MEHVSMTKIGQFRNVVKPIIDAARFIGVDETGEPIFNETKPPVLTFAGTVKLHGCLQATTKIKLWDGSQKTIKEIVNNKLRDDLLGVDSNGNTVKTKITNWFNNGKLAESEWLSFNFTRNSMGKTVSSSLKCTKNHKIYSPYHKKYVEASELNVGDTILLSRDGMDLSFTQQQILIGKMLGDGTLTYDRIEFNQIDEKYVKETIKNLGNAGFTPPSGKFPEYISGYGSTVYRGRTLNRFFIREFFGDWLGTGAKQVPNNIVLSPIAMAYWYMDDGSLAHTEFQKDRAYFATCGFSEKSIDILINKFKFYGIKASKFRTDNNKYWRIRLSTEGSYIFFQLVSPYILPSMRYKLPKEFQDENYYTGTSIVNSLDIMDTAIQKITKISSGVKGEWDLNKYDIETETHNFFANNVLVHNSNAAVCYDGNEIWAQSKNNIITPEKDNAGFASFVYNNKEYFEKLLKSLYTGDTLSLFGEFAGKGVQAKVAISEVHKSFFIFGLKVPGKGWLPLDFELEDHPNVFKITDFKTYEVEVDFDNPRLSQNKIVEMVEEVETECPVAKQFGISGIGEGIVFETTFKGKRFVFKAKGEKHVNKCKVKKLNKVDDAKLQLIQDVAEKVTPAWRLEQMWNETFDIINGGEPTIKKTGDFLRAVSQDVMKEEMDILEENELTMKDLGGTVSKIAKRWFMEKLDEEAGL